MHLSRRTFLRGASTALALPLLDAMGEGAVMAPPPRMVFLYVANGVNIFKWTPEGDGPTWNPSPTLAPLKRFKKDLTVLTGLGHPKGKGGHSGGDVWLTGADLSGTPGYDYRNSMSVDQLAAEAAGRDTRFPSLELSTSSGTGSPGWTHTLSFNRDGIPIAAESSPRELFERLFVDDGGDTRAKKEQRFRENRSILDTVTSQARALHRRLGARDREKLDAYTTSVREVERRVRRAEAWMDVPKPRIDGTKLKLDATSRDKQERRSYYRVMYDLIHLALQTDTTRIVTFLLSKEGSGGRFPEIGLKEAQHTYSHHGGDADMLEAIAKIDLYHQENLAYFLAKLAESKTEGGRLLDRTMVMFGSGMNNGKGGAHSPKNLPLLLAGGRDLGLHQGSHLRFAEGSTPLSNLLLTMVQKMGHPTRAFQDSTGPLAGLA